MGVLDRDDWACDTDNLAVVQPAQRRVVSIPRDLWCRTHRGRINRAFMRGGAPLLVEALAEHGFRVGAVVCLRRAATEHALEGVSVAVPVTRRMEFLYPLKPTMRTEDGVKRIGFDPPFERLRGERIHQWLGARKLLRGEGTDLDRIARQQVLVRCLLEQGFDFSRCLRDPSLASVSDEGAIEVLAQVRCDWRWEIHDAVRFATIDGMQVLLPTRRIVSRVRRSGRLLWDWLRGLQ